MAERGIDISAASGGWPRRISRASAPSERGSSTPIDTDLRMAYFYLSAYPKTDRPLAIHHSLGGMEANVYFCKIQEN
jgi:hypothetical protein